MRRISAALAVAAALAGCASTPRNAGAPGFVACAPTLALPNYSPSLQSQAAREMRAAPNAASSRLVTDLIYLRQKIRAACAKSEAP